MEVIKVKPDDQELFEMLKAVTIDSAWTALTSLGYPHTFINSLTCVRPDRKMVGRARTVRCTPVRKDVQAMLGHQRLNCKAADEAEPGDVIVVDAAGITAGGFTGDVVTARLITRGGAGMVVDGAIRDLNVIRTMDVAVYARGFHAAASGRAIMGVDYQVPVNCGGVTVIPGDILVGDCGGVLVIPANLAQEVAAKALETDRKEDSIRNIIETEHRSIYEVYPPDGSAALV